MLSINISCFKSVYFETAFIPSLLVSSLLGFVLITTSFNDSTAEKIFRIFLNLSSGIPQKILKKYPHFSKQIYHLIIEHNINHISKINLKDRTYEMYKMVYIRKSHDTFIKYFPKEILEQIENEISRTQTT
jgi:hypothetical protein